MATISEDYVSFEIAKLLKEKGFDNISPIMYKENGEICINPKSVVSWRLKYWYPCLTLQMAMKWLREVHHVACFICPSIEQGFHTNKWNSYIDKLSDNFPKDPLWFVETSDSYEQACEAAIKYCLENLI